VSRLNVGKGKKNEKPGDGWGRDVSTAVGYKATTSEKARDKKSAI